MDATSGHMVGGAESVVRGYHARTKHQLQRFAAGPDTLDWDAQPDPFRTWQGAALTPLPLCADDLLATWGDLFEPQGVAPQALHINTLGALLELCLGLTAWKQYGPDRWALRANPSSGNLHPTEAYVLARGIFGLADGLYHYAPREHALALRVPMRPDASAAQPPGLWIGLSSILWREAWKYGERAFRYCQLDAGHAVGAVRYAAAVLGWQACLIEGLPHADLAHLLGLDRDADFGRAEREEAELLMAVGPGDVMHTSRVPQAAWFEGDAWRGQASRLDARPMYRWPVIDEVAAASREVRSTEGAEASSPFQAAVTDAADVQKALDGSGSGVGSMVSPGHALLAAVSASGLIRGRRSAQHFDRRGVMPVAAFWRLVAALMPCQQPLPWDAWPGVARVHPVFFVHRVAGLASGAYILPRSDAGHALLAEALQAMPVWQRVADAPQSLPFHVLSEHSSLAGTLRTLSCHQAIASDACLAVSLLAEFDEPIHASPGHYRALHQEAGLIGQVLYLQAEAEGFRGTGIGCYFDDAVHELLGLRDQRVQVLYHFTVGVPMEDTRISTEPPYAHRTPLARGDLSP